MRRIGPALALATAIGPGAASGCDDPLRPAEMVPLDGGGNSCDCLVGGYVESSGEAAVAHLDADTLAVQPSEIGVSERPRLYELDAIHLIVEPTAGVIHLRDLSPARSTVEVGEPLRAVGYLGHLGTHGAVHDAPVYVVPEAGPVVRRYVRGDEATPPAAGEPVATADLSPYDDDGDPDVVEISARPDALLVVMERRQAETPTTGRILVAMLHPATLDELGTFEVPGGGLAAFDGDRSLLATRDGDEPGCLARLVTDDGDPRAECILDHAALGGTVVAMAAGWLTVEDDAGATRVVPLTHDHDSDQYAVGGPVSRQGHRPGAVANCGKWVVYADAEAGRVHVFDWTHDLWFTEPDGVSVGVPAVPSHAFACARAY